MGLNDASLRMLDALQFESLIMWSLVRDFFRHLISLSQRGQNLLRGIAIG